MSAGKHVPFYDGPHAMDPTGRRMGFRFPNGYGASVVRFRIGNFGAGSYTEGEHEWELAVIRFNGPGNDDWEIDYTTTLARDVIGHVHEDNLEALLDNIAALPEPSNEGVNP